MHGVILYSLGKFIVDLHGRSTWERAQNAAGRAGAVYLPTKIYPDQEAAALVEAIAHTTGRPPLELLEEFGMQLAPTLFAMYPPSSTRPGRLWNCWNTPANWCTGWSG
jgi:hypothetical protein